MSARRLSPSGAASAAPAHPSSPREQADSQNRAIVKQSTVGQGFNPARLALHGASAVGSVANRGLVTAASYVRRTAIAKAAAATILEIGRFTTDRTRQLIDTAALRLAPGVQRPPLPEDGWYEVGRRLCSISAYELQLIDDKIRDAGIIDFADLLGVKDPTELAKVAELRREAIKGDEEAQFALAARFCAPPFRKRKSCARCGCAFGVTRYRHHCRHCGESFCQEHSPFRHPIPKLGHLTPARVCHACKTQLEEEDLKDRIVWRMARLEALLQGRLIPYFEPAEDSRLERARRCVEGAISMAKSVPIRTTAALAGEALDLLRKYGLSGMAGVLLRSECIEAIELLKRVSGVDEAWPMSAHQLSAGMYFLLAKHRAERGGNPDLEREAARNCGPIGEELLQDVLSLAPLPLHFAYCATPVEMQVRAKQQGWELVFCQHQSQPGQPAFALFCNPEIQEASLVVRGTSDIQDLAMEIRALPLPFPQALTTSGERGGWTSVSGTTERLASSGVGGAAQWLFTEVYAHLRRLMDEGYHINLLGHSLGGAVAALLGVLLREEGITTGIKCYAFGSPACVNGPLAKACEAFCTVVVLHDDVIPRITPDSIRGLLRDLLQERESVMRLWRDDLEAIIVKAKGLWAPRWRRIDVGRSSGSVDKATEEKDEAGGGAAGGRGGGSGGSQEAGGTYDPFSGWDSGDDDFEDYFGIGCTREVQPKKPARSQGPGCYSIRLSDGSTTTVDIDAARRRLLGGDYGSQPQQQQQQQQESAAKQRGMNLLGHDDEDEEEGEGGEEEGEEEESLSSSRGSSSLGSQSQHRSSASGSPVTDRRRDRSSSRDSGDDSAPAPQDDDEDNDEAAAEEEGRVQPQDDDDDDEEEDDEGEGLLASLFPVLSDEAGSPRSPIAKTGFGDKQASFSPAAAKASPAAGSRGLLTLSASPFAALSTVGRGGSASPATKTPARQGKHAEPQAAEASEARAAAAVVPPEGKEQPPPAVVVEEEEEEEEECAGEEGMCVVEDVELPDMYLPGKVVHIYSDRGVFRACMPTRDFVGLRRIVMAGNMLGDHEARAYFEALCEVLDVRKAFQDPPVWQSFNDADSCSCCGTTLETPLTPTSSETQRGREKHNCRCCGLVVCQNCSTHRRALPTIGLAQLVRVCNRCFFGAKQHGQPPHEEQRVGGKD